MPADKVPYRLVRHSEARDGHGPTAFALLCFALLCLTYRPSYGVLYTQTLDFLAMDSEASDLREPAAGL